jgi:hypothetical protein
MAKAKSNYTIDLKKILEIAQNRYDRALFAFDALIENYEKLNAAATPVSTDLIQKSTQDANFAAKNETRLAGKILTAASSACDPEIIRNFSKSLIVLFEERKRFADKQVQDAGIVYDFAVDLEAARVEVERRLADLVEGRNVEGHAEEIG